MNLPPLLRVLLWPLSVLYGAFVQCRLRLYERGWLEQKHLKGTVISVGNLTVGGTGKTPMVIWLAEKFLAEGKRVAILSRGYRGASGTSDEVELMKFRLQDRVTFGVGKNRFAQGRKLESKQSVDIFLLDDGFQHLPLARDLDILMLDGSVKLKSESLLPSGPLREPISACRRADILIVTRKFERPEIEAKDSHQHSIFYAQTRLLGFRRLGKEAIPEYLSDIGPGPFFAFCGIGSPKAFLADLGHWHVPIAGSKSFRDHHVYSRGDVRGLEEAATRCGATALVTTEKDAQNLKAATEFRLPVHIAVIDFVFSSESELLATIERSLSPKTGAAA